VPRSRVRRRGVQPSPLATAFDLSYASLGEPHRHLFRRLGLVPGPDIDGYAAAALQESEPAVVSRKLGDLVDHNLVIAHASGRFRLHDLIRARARALEIYRALGHRHGQAVALAGLGHVRSMTGDLPGAGDALALYRRALTMNRELGKPDDEAIAHEGLGECSLAAGETETGVGRLRAALAIFQRLGMVSDAERVRTRLAEPARSAPWQAVPSSAARRGG
jgi:hypothetical protein